MKIGAWDLAGIIHRVKNKCPGGPLEDEDFPSGLPVLGVTVRNNTLAGGPKPNLNPSKA